jgi:hypothetical protein
MKESGWYYIGSFVFGAALAWLFLSGHYDTQYTKLRSEIIEKTGVDISYPNNDCRLNDTIYGGRIETVYCKREGSYIK